MIPLRVTFMNVICAAEAIHVKVFSEDMYATMKPRNYMTNIWTKDSQKHSVQYAKKSERNV